MKELKEAFEYPHEAHANHKVATLLISSRFSRTGNRLCVEILTQLTPELSPYPPPPCIDCGAG